MCQLRSISGDWPMVYIPPPSVSHIEYVVLIEKTVRCIVVVTH